VGINDLARATALASVGLSPSTATKCASRAQDGTSAAGAARCPSTVFLRWTSVAGAASAPGAAAGAWTSAAGAAWCPSKFYTRFRC
jgi:hypothetical protein